MRPGRGERRIGERRHRQLNPGHLGAPAVLRRRRTRARCRRGSPRDGSTPPRRARRVASSPDSTPAKRRQRRHGVVDLGHRAAHADVPDPPRGLWRQVHGIDEREHGPARIRRRHDRAPHESPRRCPARRQTAVSSFTRICTNPGARPNLDASGARGSGECRRHRADSADRRPAGRDWLVGAGAEPQERGRRACRARSGKSSQEAGGRHRGSKRLALEPLGDEVGRRHRRPAEQPVRVGLAKRSEGRSRSQEREEIAGRQVVDVRRRRRHQRSQHRADRLHARQERGIGLGVARRERRNRRGRRPHIAPERERPAVARGRCDQRLRSDHAQAVSLELERGDDPGIDVGPVRQRRAGKPWRDLARDCRAADPIARFDDERAQPGLRQHRGRHQAVVARADDDDVKGHDRLRAPGSGLQGLQALGVRHQIHNSTSRSRSPIPDPKSVRKERMRRAALRPARP